MNFETLAFGVAGLAVTTLLLLVGYTGDRMQKSIDQLREMLDVRLSEVSVRLASIDRDLRTEITSITQENHILDRRVTRIETYFERRDVDKPHRQDS